MRKGNRFFLLVFVLTIAITGCGGGGGGGGGGGATTPETQYSISGSAQKGPFLVGSTVLVTQLTTQGEATSNSVETETEDSLGNFRFVMEQQAATLITVNGYQYNELTGGIANDKLTLRAVYNVTNSNQQLANVNILTHLIHDRVIELMRSGQSVVVAISTAEQEWVSGFSTVLTVNVNESFSSLDLYQESENTLSQGNDYLLYISAVFYQYATNLAAVSGNEVEVKLTELLNTVANDFKTDGTLDSDGILEQLIFAASQLDANEIASNLQSLGLQFSDTKLYVSNIKNLVSNVLILSPADNAAVSDLAEVKFTIPANLNNVEYSLLIDGEIIDSVSITELTPEQIDAGQLGFNWQPYYWASSGRHTLVVQTKVDSFISNSNLVTVSVSADTRSVLELLTPLDGYDFDNQNQVAFEWQEIKGAQNYSIQISNDNFNTILEESTLTGPSFESSNLVKGNYSWRVNAINSQGVTGPWTSQFDFTVSGPLAPDTFNAETLNQNNGVFDVNFDWNGVQHAVGYKIEVSEDPQFNHIIAGNTITPIQESLKLPVGTYHWRVLSINDAGIEGDWSIPVQVDVGVFRSKFGADGDEYAAEIIRSNSGGYLVRATQNSQHWILRVSEEGKKVDEYLFGNSNHPNPRYLKMYESIDGSIYLVGDSFKSRQGTTLKLNSELDLVWESLYKPPGSVSTDHYLFTSIIEWDGKLYLSAHGSETIDNRLIRNHTALHEIYESDGFVTEEILLPSLSSIEINSITHFLISASGDLVVAGYATDSTGLPRDIDFDGGGVFLLSLNKDFELLNLWESAGDNTHINNGSTVELSNGDFAVLGQDLSGQGFISGVSDTGETNAQFQGIRDMLYQNSTPLAVNNTGGFSGIFKDFGHGSRTNPMVLIGFDNNMIEISRRYLFDELESFQSSMVANPDGTVTLLLTSKPNSSNNYDIVVRKIKKD